MKTTAERLCRENNVPFADTFRYQYVISDQVLELPSFNAFKVGEIYVQTGEALDTAVISDQNGQDIGVMLGVAADHAGCVPKDVIAQNLNAASKDCWHDFEHYLVQVSGRYAFIINMGGETRYYADPVGMIGAVYSREFRRLGSSLYLVIDRDVVPHPLYDHELFASGGGSYGLSHTQDAHVARLNASHYFDLNTFTSQRFWPFAEDQFTAEPSEYGAIYDEMIDATRNIIESLAARYPVSMPLSGGNDSRILFALAGEKGRAQIDQYFTHINNYANRRDASIAAMLAVQQNRPYQVHDFKHVSIPKFEKRKRIRKWRIGSGTHAQAPPELKNGLLDLVLEDSVVMRGHQTNIMRGQYFNARTPKRTRFPRWQLAIMKLAANLEDPAINEAFTEELAAHTADLPPNTESVTSDFIFFETLVPAALGLLFQGLSNAFYMSPFNSRRLVQLSMQFDVSHKLQNLATHDLILRAEPAMSGIPFHYDILGELREDDEGYAKRQKRQSYIAERYRKLFNETPPKVEMVPFDPSHYDKARDEAKNSD